MQNRSADLTLAKLLKDMSVSQRDDQNRSRERMGKFSKALKCKCGINVNILFFLKFEKNRHKIFST